MTSVKGTACKESSENNQCIFYLQLLVFPTAVNSVQLLWEKR